MSVCNQAALNKIQEDYNKYKNELIEYNKKMSDYDNELSDYNDREGKYSKYKWYGKHENVVVSRYPRLRKGYEDACVKCAKGEALKLDSWGEVLCYYDIDRTRSRRHHKVTTGADDYEFLSGSSETDSVNPAGFFGSIYFQCKKSEERVKLENKEYEKKKPEKPSINEPQPPQKTYNCCRIIMDNIHAGNKINIDNVKKQCEGTVTETDTETGIVTKTDAATGRVIKTDTETGNLFNFKKDNMILYGVGSASLCICCVFVIILFLMSGTNKSPLKKIQKVI